MEHPAGLHGLLAACVRQGGRGARIGNSLDAVRIGPMQALRPRLTAEHKEQLMECFDLMDADGSGAIDADEMGAAFKARP
jgi:hypothetical protein